MRVAEVEGELRCELTGALYLIADQANVDAAEEAGLAATVPQCATYATALLPPGCTAVVLIDVVGESEVRRIVARECPHLTIYSLSLGMSLATFLGYDATRATSWSPEQAAVAREKLIGHACMRALRVGNATAEAPAAFPVDVLPPTLRALATEGAAAMGVDPAFYGAPMLAVLAGAVGASRHVIVRPGWIEPAVLWVAVIGPSGSGKSGPLDVLLRPVRERDADMQRANALALEQHRAAVAAQKRQDAATGEALRVPPMQHALVDDVTIEALAVRLCDNPRGLLLGSDELAAWFGGFDAYRSGRGADEAKWLALFGCRQLKVDRKGGGTIFVERPAVSVVGGTQPRVIARLLDRQRRESGLAARLLFAAPPTRAATWTDACIAGDTLRAWGFVVRSLLDLGMCDEPIGLPLSSSATGLFRAWHDRSAEDGQAAAMAGNEDIAAAGAKLRSIVPRIALVLALARAAEDGVAELLRVVDDVDMRAAIALGDYFTAQAHAFYAKVHAEGTSTTGRVLARIREGGDDGATRTNIRDALGRNATANEIDEAIGSLLANRLIVPMPPVAGPGRPAERWRAA